MFSGHFFRVFFLLPIFQSIFLAFFRLFFSRFFNFSNFPSENFEADASKKNHATSHAKVSKRCITNKERSEPLSTKSTFSSENQRKKNDFSWFFKKVAARKTRSRKAQPALFRLCNALKRFFWTLSLLNWTQLSSPLRAEWRSIFPGKFSSRPHARHSPDQAKRVNAPPLRLFRVRHRDPGGNRRISPPFFHPSLSPTFSSCPPRRRSFHQSASSW